MHYEAGTILNCSVDLLTIMNPKVSYFRGASVTTNSYLLDFYVLQEGEWFCWFQHHFADIIDSLIDLEGQNLLT